MIPERAPAISFETVTTLAGSANNLKSIAEELNKDIEFFK
jgi:hypothetical protein